MPLNPLQPPLRPPLLPPAVPPPNGTCRLVYGVGDCSELNYCSGRGNCTDGLCVCPPGFIDAQCSVSIDCNFWSDDLGAWSSEGVSSTIRGGSVVCSTTHLTTFGGIISLPTSVDELLKELASEFRFNTFSLDEAFDLLSSFSIADNPTITSILLTMASLNVLTVGCLGWYRGHRMALHRRRENRLTGNEKMAHKLRMAEKRLKNIESLNPTPPADSPFAARLSSSLASGPWTLASGPWTSAARLPQHIVRRRASAARLAVYSRRPLFSEVVPGGAGGGTTGGAAGGATRGAAGGAAEGAAGCAGGGAT